MAGHGQPFPAQATAQRARGHQKSGHGNGGRINVNIPHLPKLQSVESQESYIYSFKK